VCTELGRPLSEIVGKTDHDFDPPTAADKSRLDDLAVVAHGEVHETVEEYEAADRTKLFMQVTRIPIRDDAGRVIGIQVMSLDITDKKRAEIELRRSEERLSRAVNGSNAGLWDWDFASNEIYFSPRFKESIGYGPDEFEDSLEAFLEHLHPDDRDPVHDALRAHFAHGTPFDIEYRLRNKAGTYRWFQARGQAVWDESGNATRMAGSIFDIHERKRAEEESRRARVAAEAASRAKSEFLANVSHEIRTPMNGVIGMTDLALDTSLSAEQRGYLEMVKTSADALLTVINDILDFSKIEAGKLELDPTRLDLPELLDDTLKPLAHRALTKGLTLSCRIAPGVPRSLVGDAGRFRQVIVNLVGNAVKFTDHGSITISAEVDERTETHALLHVSVADTGIGIAKDRRQAIFEAFTQADGSNTRKYGGTGLGLAISAKLAALMGGRIWVEGEEGVGSTFHFTARLEICTEPAAARTVADVSELEGLPILIVDDNRMNRLILSEALIGWKARPTAVEDGVAALRSLKAAADRGTPFRLVLLDCVMAEINGFEVAARIKADPQLAGTRLIMLSSSGVSGESAACRERRIDAYLVKPIKQPELLEAILTCLGQPEAVSTPAQPNAAPTNEPKAQRPRGLKILLAEDNSVNQVLAVKMLEKAGHEVMVAGNGAEVLIRLETDSYDVILMDLQMPEMDGFEATSLIREHECERGGHVPIVALTAHAMKGDRERCLESGFDEYLSKPIRALDLMDILAKIVPAPQPIPRPEPVSVPKPTLTDTVFDRAGALDRVGHEEEILREVLGMFVENTPGLMMQIRESIEREDFATLRRATHTLQGTASNFTIPGALKDAYTLENMARAGDISGASQPLVALEATITRLLSAIEVDLVSTDRILAQSSAVHRLDHPELDVVAASGKKFMTHDCVTH
jgi:PAS domain S-box-containing protein